MSHAFMSRFSEFSPIDGKLLVHHLNDEYYYCVVDMSSRYYMILLSINILSLAVLCILSYGSVFMIFVNVTFGGVVIDHELNMDRIQVFTQCFVYILISFFVLVHIVIFKDDNSTFKQHLVSWPEMGQFVLMIRWFCYVLQASYIYTGTDNAYMKSEIQMSSSSHSEATTVYLYVLTVSQLCVFAALQFPPYCTYLFALIDCGMLMIVLYQWSAVDRLLYMCVYLFVAVCLIGLCHFLENTGISQYAQVQLSKKCGEEQRLFIAMITQEMNQAIVPIEKIIKVVGNGNVHMKMHENHTLRCILYTKQVSDLVLLSLCAEEGSYQPLYNKKVDMPLFMKKITQFHCETWLWPKHSCLKVQCSVGEDFKNSSSFLVFDFTVLHGVLSSCVWLATEYMLKCCSLSSEVKPHLKMSISYCPNTNTSATGLGWLCCKVQFSLYKNVNIPIPSISGHGLDKNVPNHLLLLCCVGIVKYLNGRIGIAELGTGLDRHMMSIELLLPCMNKTASKRPVDLPSHSGMRRLGVFDVISNGLGATLNMIATIHPESRESLLDVASLNDAGTRMNTEGHGKSPVLSSHILKMPIHVGVFIPSEKGEGNWNASDVADYCRLVEVINREGMIGVALDLGLGWTSPEFLQTIGKLVIIYCYSFEQIVALRDVGYDRILVYIVRAESKASVDYNVSLKCNKILYLCCDDSEIVTLKYHFLRRPDISRYLEKLHQTEIDVQVDDSVQSNLASAPVENGVDATKLTVDNNSNEKKDVLAQSISPSAERAPHSHLGFDAANPSQSAGASSQNYTNSAEKDEHVQTEAESDCEPSSSSFFFKSNLKEVFNGHHNSCPSSKMNSLNMSHCLGTVYSFIGHRHTMPVFSPPVEVEYISWVFYQTVFSCPFSGWTRCAGTNSNAIACDSAGACTTPWWEMPPNSNSIKLIKRVAIVSLCIPMVMKCVFQQGYSFSLGDWCLWITLFQIMYVLFFKILFEASKSCYQNLTVHSYLSVLVFTIYLPYLVYGLVAVIGDAWGLHQTSGISLELLRSNHLASIAYVTASVISWTVLLPWGYAVVELIFNFLLLVYMFYTHEFYGFERGDIDGDGGLSLFYRRSIFLLILTLCAFRVFLRWYVEHLLRFEFQALMRRRYAKGFLHRCRRMYIENMKPAVERLIDSNTTLGLVRCGLMEKRVELSKELLVDVSLYRTAMTAMETVYSELNVQADRYKDCLDFIKKDARPDARWRMHPLETFTQVESDLEWEWEWKPVRNVLKDVIAMAHEVMEIACLYDQYMGHDIEVYVHGDPSLSIVRTNKAQLQKLLHSSISFAIQNIFQLYLANPKSHSETQEIVIRLYPSKATVASTSMDQASFAEKKSLMSIEVYDSGLNIFSSAVNKHDYKKPANHEEVGFIPEFNKTQGFKNAPDAMLTPFNVDPAVYHNSTRATNYYFSFHEHVCRSISRRYGETYEICNVLHYKYSNKQILSLPFYNNVDTAVHRNVLFGQLSRAKVDSNVLVNAFCNGSILTKKVLLLDKACDNPKGQLNSKMLFKYGWEVHHQVNLDFNSIIENLDGCTMVLIDTLVMDDFVMSPAVLVEELRLKGYGYAIVCLKQNYEEEVSQASLFDGVITKPVHESMRELEKINTACYIGKIFNIEAGHLNSHWE